VRHFDGSILYWTHGAQELYGFTPEEAIGRMSHELLQTVFPEELSVIEARLRASGEWRGRLCHVTRNGQKIWTESLWRLRPTDLVVEQNTDVTDRIELERQREVATLELTHRINNILGVVQAVARTSFGSSNPEGMRDFEIRALSEANRVLTQGHRQRPFLRKLISDVAQDREGSRKLPSAEWVQEPRRHCAEQSVDLHSISKLVKKGRWISSTEGCAVSTEAFSVVNSL
jgi:PAS domain S-box-containing protein